MNKLALSVILLATPVMATAQDGAAARGAAAITESLIERHITVIADDSMLGRDTPSRGLELTARYVADQFKRFGLRPGGDSSSYLQRYAIAQRKLDGERSSLRLSAGPVNATVSFEQDARFVYGSKPSNTVSGPVLLLAGSVDSAALVRASVAGHLVLLVADFAKSTRQINAVLTMLLPREPLAVIIVSNRDGRSFDRMVQSQFGVGVGVNFETSMEPPVVEVHDRAAAAALKAAGVSLTEARAAAAPMVRKLPELEVGVTVAEVTVSEATAPNTVGILEGTDPVLKNEYIVFSAHMDHVGVNGANARDSIWNGADDDASGTAGVIALAEAFARAPTKRSLIFLTVSGEEKGLWGSEWFATHSPVPVAQIVANLNLDMIGRNWKDTIVVIGKEHSDLGATLERVNKAHPELGMSAIDDIWPSENFYFRSDHYNFARRGVPILFFFNGTHADYHQPGDSPDKIDAEKESRIVKLIYYLGQEVGNAAARPKWDPESYKQIVK